MIMLLLLMMMLLAFSGAAQAQAPRLVTARVEPATAEAALFRVESLADQLRRELRNRPELPVAQSPSDSSGLVRLTAPHEGPWRLVVSQPGEPTRVPMEVLLPPLPEVIELPAVRLPVGEPARVEVRTPDGDPAPWSWVSPAPVSGPAATRRHGWQPHRTAGFTDERGLYSFLLETESQQPMQLRISNEWGTSLRTVGQSDAVQHEPLDEPSRFLLELDDESGDQVRDAVILVDGRPVANGVKQPVEIWLSPGSTVSAISEGRSGRTAVTRERQSIQPQSINPQRIKLVLEPDRRVTGTLVDKDSRRPIPGAFVRSDGRWSKSDRKGRFEISLSSREGPRLDVYASGYLPLLGERLRKGVIPMQRSASVAGIVLDRHREPVEGAELTLGHHAARTREDGTFRFADVEPDRSLTLSARYGDALERLPSVLEIETPSAGESRSDLEVELRRPHTVTGSVVTAADERTPIEGASVRIAVYHRERSPSTHQTTTDSLGQFTFPELDPPYRSSTPEGVPSLEPMFEISAEGFARTTFRRSLDQHGEETVLDPFELESESFLILEVTDLDNAPLEGAEAALKTDLRPTAFQVLDAVPELPGYELLGARSDEDGRLVLGSLTEGRPVDLLIARDGYVTSRASGLEPTKDPQGLSSRAQPITIRLTPEAAVAGRVLSSNGDPVEDAHVAVAAENPTASLPPNLFDKTDSSGRFRIDALPAGRYRIWARATGQPEFDSLWLDLEQGRERSDVELRAPPAAFVEGYVLDRDGLPLSGIKVVCSEQLVSSDRDGSFFLEPIALGPRRVEARLPNGVRVVREIVVGPEGTSVTLRPGADPDTRTTTVSGAVVDTDGLALEGIRVTLAQWSSNRFDQTRTDQDGMFLFEGVIPGSYFLAANSARGRPAGERSDLTVRQKSIEVGSEPMVRLILGLEFAALLRAQLKGDDPDRIEPWIVVAQHHDGSERRTFLGGGTSRFEIASLRPGRYQIQIRSASEPPRRVATHRVEISPGESEVDIDIAIEEQDEEAEGAVLEGRITLLGPAPTRLWLVLAEPGSRSSRSTARANYLGHYEFERVAAGTYDLMIASDSTLLSHLDRFDLRADTSLDFVLEPRDLTATVVDAQSGVAIEGASVMVIGARGDTNVGPVTRRRTDRDGWFSLRVLTSTDQLLLIQHPAYQETTVPVVALENGSPIPLWLRDSGP